jgi:hypothetical protein
MVMHTYQVKMVFYFTIDAESPTEAMSAAEDEYAEKGTQDADISAESAEEQ